MGDQTLADVVLTQAENDDDLSEQSKLLIMAALDGDSSLAGALGSEVFDPPANSTRELASGSAPEPVGAFLSSIEVTGFRGVGARVKMNLHPGPGLTVIAGRNGSGKSSFSEALELALTGDSYRWTNKPTQWTTTWRNLHQPDPCTIRIGLAEEGSGLTTIGVDWESGAELAGKKVWTQRPGTKREAGTSSLGWKTALDLYRPILSYEELGRLLEARPLDLYQALERILGLEQINDAARRLDIELKRVQAPEAEARARKAELREALEQSADDRAPGALTELRKHKPDLGALSRTALRTESAGSGGTALRALTQRSLPGRSVVSRVAQELRNAVTAAVQCGEFALSLVERRGALLSEALQLHAHHGDMPCPVCGEGALDRSWRDRVSTQLTSDNQHAASLRSAQAELRRCREAATVLVESIPPFVLPAEIEMTTLEPVRSAHEQFRRMPTTDSELADHIVTAYEQLNVTFDALRDEAETLLCQRDDRWGPIAHRLAHWVDLKRQALSNEESAKDLQQAAKWLKANAGKLRNQQLEPLAEQARTIWARLRQESNVDLGAITLEGQGNHRHVALGAEIDGQNAGALAVMSQGELHALALALFLPRASRPESPLRFVVLDDPVQAMDPAKIDGLVQVLCDLAVDRQVVVFTHDDRLAEVVRRVADNSRIIEVTRETESRVFTRDSLSPALRYFADVRDLTKDGYLPKDVLARVLPGLCRLALEAAARDTFYRIRLCGGAKRATTEETWLDAKTTKKRVALALKDDPEADISKWRNAKPWRAATLAISTGGVHQALNAQSEATVENLRRTVNDLLAAR